MPVLNGERFIAKAIESVINQSYMDWQLLVVDDGSLDATVEIVSRLARKERRIILVKNEARSGLGPVRNQALAAANTELCAVLDADDCVHEHWLRSRISVLDARADVVAASGSRKIIDESGRIMRCVSEPLHLEDASWALRFGNPVVHSSTVFRRTAVNLVGGYGTGQYFEDWVLFRRLLRVGKIVQGSDFLVSYRVHHSNTSAKMEKHLKEREKLVEDVLQHELYGGLRPCPANLAWILYRDRAPIRAEHLQVVEAFRYLCSEFESSEGRSNSARSRSSSAVWFLKDARNVLRSGGWTPRSAIHAIRLALRTCQRRGERWGPVAKGCFKLCVASVR